jgi:hypothetical protein
VLERDARALRQVSGRSGPGDELRQPRDVVGLHVGLEHRHDRDPLALRQRDVAIDQVDVRIDDRELRLALASEQIGGAGGLVVEQLAEVHAATVRPSRACS